MKHKAEDVDLSVMRSVIEHLKQELNLSGFRAIFENKELSSGVTLFSNLKNDKTLDIELTISGGEATINYHNSTYSNYGEIAPSRDEDINAYGADISQVILNYLHKGAVRKDKYIGDRLVSSALSVDGTNVTTDIKGFKLLGRRRVKETRYLAPLDLMQLSKSKITK